MLVFKKIIIPLITLITMGVVYYFGINYMVFETGKGRPISEKYLSINKNNTELDNGLTMTIHHSYPLVNFSDCKLFIEGVLSGKVLYYGHFKNNIKISALPNDEPIRFILVKNKKEYVYGSKGTMSESIKNTNRVNTTLFLNYQEKYSGWYRLEKDD